MTVTERKRKKSPHQPVGRWIRKDKRLAIYLRDGFTCGICLGEFAPHLLTLDHVRPRKKGGTNEATNLYACCRACNFSRQDRPLARAASPEALQRLRAVRRRKLDQYLSQARALLV